MHNKLISSGSHTHSLTDSLVRSIFELLDQAFHLVSVFFKKLLRYKIQNASWFEYVIFHDGDKRLPKVYNKCLEHKENNEDDLYVAFVNMNDVCIGGYDRFNHLADNFLHIKLLCLNKHLYRLWLSLETVSIGAVLLILIFI